MTNHRWRVAELYTMKTDTSTCGMWMWGMWPPVATMRPPASTASATAGAATATSGERALSTWLGLWLLGNSRARARVRVRVRVRVRARVRARG